MHIIPERYLAINPRLINPFNLPHHRFVPSDDPAADARFLRDVADGVTPRFYVTLSEDTRGSLRFHILVMDKYNQNVVSRLQVERKTPYASLDDYASRVYQRATELATELGADFYGEPEDCAVHSFAAFQLLRRAHAQAQGIAVIDWPVAAGGSGITPPAPAVSNLVPAMVQR